MATSDILMLDGASGPDRQETLLAGGNLCAYTCRAPEKDTDNEDSAAAIGYGDDAAVLVVSDGAGGLPAGRRASRTAVEALAAALHAGREADLPIRAAVMNGVEAANQAVRDMGTGSATTLTVVAIEGRTARTFQVGDSEALIVGQRGRIRAQTMAHSPTGFAVEAGLLDQRDALHHAERHLVTNFIGTADMRIDVGAVVELQSRDTVLLASDGLTDNLHMHEIIEIVRKGPLPAALDRLTALAGERMHGADDAQPSKPDDLSILLFRKPAPSRPRKTARRSD